MAFSSAFLVLSFKTADVMRVLAIGDDHISGLNIKS